MKEDTPNTTIINRHSIFPYFFIPPFEVELRERRDRRGGKAGLWAIASDAEQG